MAAENDQFGAVILTGPVERAAAVRPNTWLDLVMDFAGGGGWGRWRGGDVLLLLVALLAGVIAPYDPLDTSFLEQLKPPSLQHLLGTDAFGRDVLSRLIYGSRTALKVGFGAAFVGSSLGALLGVISAYFGGKVDLLLERLMDI